MLPPFLPFALHKHKLREAKQGRALGAAGLRDVVGEGQIPGTKRQFSAILRRSTPEAFMAVHAKARLNSSPK